MVFFVYAKILRFFKKALEKQKNALHLQYTIKLIHTDMKRFVVFTIMLMVALTASAKGKCDWKGKVEWGRIFITTASSPGNWAWTKRPGCKTYGHKKSIAFRRCFFVCPERESNPHGIATTGF